MTIQSQVGVVVTGSIHIERTGRGARKVIRKGPVPLAPEPGRVPRVARLMALAIHFDELMREGLVRDYAELARLGQVTRARMTQVEREFRGMSRRAGVFDALEDKLRTGLFGTEEEAVKVLSDRKQRLSLEVIEDIPDVIETPESTDGP